MGDAMKFTGERFVPTEEGQIRLEHLHRYAALLPLVRDRAVLDIACGEGYGAAMLAAEAGSVIGVDVAAEAVTHARSKYHLPNLSFETGSVAKIPLPEAAVDVVVSFETVEHVAEQEAMVREIRRVLRPDGFLVLSSPNRPVYSPDGQEPNPFHVKELDFEELDALLRVHFPAIRYLGQRLTMGSVIQPLDRRRRIFYAFTEEDGQLHPAAAPITEPMYYVALCAADQRYLPAPVASLLQPGGSDLVDHYLGYARWAQALDKELEAARNLVRELQEAHEGMARWGQESAAALEQARERHAGLHEEHTKTAAWCHELQQQNETTLKELESARTQIKELESARTQINELQSAHDAMARSRQESAAALEQALQRHAALQHEHAKTAAWCNELQAERDTARTLSNELREAHDALAKRAQESAAALEQAQKRHAALQVDHNKITTRYQELQVEHETAREALRNSTEAVRGLEIELAQARAQGQNQAGLLASLREQLDQAQQRVADLEVEAQLLATERARGEGLASELSRRELEVQRAASENVRLSGWVMSLTGEVDELKRRTQLQEDALAADAGELERRLVEEALARSALEGRLAEESRARLDAEATAQALRGSLSWRMMAPVRLAGAGAQAALRKTMLASGWTARKAGATLQRALPVSPFTRRRLNALSYAKVPALFRDAPPFLAWREKGPEVHLLAERLRRCDPAEVGRLVPPGDRHRKPVASVIIPIYGQVDFTLKCLRSILDARPATPYEIVLMDDCSPDLSVELLCGLPNINFRGNSTNQGFIRTCNRGASFARGEYLLFLNNDTEVVPGWLDAMVQTFADVPACGIVGSQLLYPDGRLQEAGGIIWNDGSGWNYGNRDDPRKPEYSYRRDVDYVSGASLMVPADLFARLGGFDEHYAPAYGEDSDLAFRVRREGLRVVYQPKSWVVHHEGGTMGTDVTQGLKTYQVENARKLVERWREAMAVNGTPGVEPLLAKDRNTAGRVLVVDHCTPTPDQDAGSITALNIMKLLQARGLKVTFVPEDNMAFLAGYTEHMQQMGIECLYAPFVPNLTSHLAERGHTYDLVLFFRAEVARRHLDAFELHCPQAKLVFHTSDLHHLRELRQAEVEGSAEVLERARRTRDLELSTMRRAHATIVHSTAEKEMLDAELGWRDQKRIFVFGWAIPIPGTRAPRAGRDGVVMIGGYQHGPNVDAVEYFVREIFPAVRARLPSSRFLVVGSKVPPKLEALAGNGVEIVGFVEDLGPLLDSCIASVAPLRYGAGVKGKIYTSLAHGLPCISTTIGVEGMEMTDGTNVLVADDPAAFAEAVIRLHEDEATWRKLSENGNAYIHANASLDVGARIVGDILETLGAVGPPLAGGAPAAGAPAPRESLVRSRAEHEAHLATPLARRQAAYEEALAKRHTAEDVYLLPGWCEVCESHAWFRVDKQSGARVRDDGTWIPNWRERCECTGCGMNSRQRVIAARAKSLVQQRSSAGARTDVYLTEQVTAIFARLSATLPQASWTGSEYLGPDVAPGSVVRGIRHEDVERLSFAEGSFDLIVSNDVLEHVNRPELALAEMRRVLRPGGLLLLTAPFHVDLDRHRRRAEITESGLVHHLPAEYHGNPVSEDGSLVFVDFGWELLEQMRDLGYGDPKLHHYWSDWLGYLGIGQHYLSATRLP
jgi:GT2 family glycosyltransferase/2-polyprenyl-3-methyl-5-hydroxy-6-metoxy-1,4-benzoquinol methylase